MRGTNIGMETKSPLYMKREFQNLGNRNKAFPNPICLSLGSWLPFLTRFLHASQEQALVFNIIHCKWATISQPDFYIIIGSANETCTHLTISTQTEQKLLAQPPKEGGGLERIWKREGIQRLSPKLPLQKKEWRIPAWFIKTKHIYCRSLIGKSFK